MGPQTLTSEIFKVKKYECANYNSNSNSVVLETNDLYKNISYANCKSDAFNSLLTTEYFNNLKCININGTVNVLNVECIKQFYHIFATLL
jgi:hypothetical protein